jgi:hypothetical protein
MNLPWTLPNFTEDFILHHPKFHTITIDKLRSDRFSSAKSTAGLLSEYGYYFPSVPVNLR